MPQETPIVTQELPEAVRIAVLFANERVAIAKDDAIRLEEMNKEKLREVAKLDMSAEEKRISIGELAEAEHQATLSAASAIAELARVESELTLLKSDYSVLIKEKVSLEDSIIEKSISLSQLVEQLRAEQAEADVKASLLKEEIASFESRKQALQIALASI